MANLIRVPKHSNDWTQEDLKAYNIQVISKDEEGFFGEKLLEYIPMESLEKRLEVYLKLGDRGSSITNLSRELLYGLKFGERSKLLIGGERLPLIVCGNTSVAQTSVCVINRRTESILFINKCEKEDKDPEPQAIAGAIAAFQYNNRIRKNMDLDKIDEMTIPCITMRGIFPSFYLVPVTKGLSDHVMGGAYPDNTTEVLKYFPEKSMKSDRNEILKYCESFKKFVDNLEKRII
jgi:hypothetical protein